MESRLEFEIQPQPDDAACGPTCLQAVYRFYGDDVPLHELSAEIPRLETGGTLAVLLAGHALRRGYGARIYTYNLSLFDPTWFSDPAVDLADRLRRQATAKADARLRTASEGFLEYLALGGELRFEDLRPALVRGYLKRGRPLLCGLSATYLYGCAREAGRDHLVYDDVRGTPTGHFVVLCGYAPKERRVLVADPLQDNPRYGVHYYWVHIQRVLGAILLGVLTYDANLLVLEPPPRKGARA
jgi:hypothetical protein